jgi:hypothetical protein
VWKVPAKQKLVEKVVSGGQTGADRAALDWAIANNIEHSGWCPKGRLAEDGIIAPKYCLTETSSSTYAERTELNVRDADATVIFTINPQLTGGSLWTLTCAQTYQKPWLHLVRLEEGAEASDRLLNFLQQHSIRVLNIAGSRQSKENQVYDFVFSTLSATYEKSGH